MTEFIDTENRFFGERIHQEAARRGAEPFVRFADHAATMASGIEVVVGLLRRDAANRDFEDSGPTLGGHQIDALLGLVQVSAFAMADRASYLQSWANEYFAPEDRK